jgi:hypothetical protein
MSTIGETYMASGQRSRAFAIHRIFRRYCAYADFSASKKRAAHHLLLLRPAPWQITSVPVPSDKV